MAPSPPTRWRPCVTVHVKSGMCSVAATACSRLPTRSSSTVSIVTMACRDWTSVSRSRVASACGKSGKERLRRLDEPVVQGLHGLFRTVAWDHPGDSERGGGDHRGRDPRLLEQRRAGAHVRVARVDSRAHRADGRQAVDQPGLPAEARLEPGAEAGLVVQVLARDDHVHAVVEHVQLLARDAALVEQGEDLRRLRVGLEDDDVRLARDAGDGAGHAGRRLANDRAVNGGVDARQRAGRRASVDREPLFLRELHCLRVEHLRAGFRHLLRFLVRQRADATRRGNHARVGGVDAVHVGADLAVLRVERRGHRDRGRVAPAAAERGHFLPVRHALVAGDDDNLSARELVLHAERAHLDDPRVDVAIVGDDAGLAAGEADRVAAELVNRERQQRHGDALAGRQQHVELAPLRVRRDHLRHRQQLVGGVAHRGDDDHDAVPLGARPHHALGDTPELVHVRDAAAAVFLDDHGHGLSITKSRGGNIKDWGMRMTFRAFVAALLLTFVAAAPNAAQQPSHREPDVVFVPTPPAVVDAMLRLARVTSSQVVYDLGSGDDPILIAAAKMYSARGGGIDIDRQRGREATARARAQNVADKVTFPQEDLFTADISPATVVTIYLSPTVNSRLAPKLMTELKPGTRIVSHAVDLGSWKPQHQIKVSDRPIFLWTVGPTGSRYGSV